MRHFIVLLIAVLLAACGQEAPKSAATTPDQPKAVAEPMVAAKGYYDGSDTAPWLALNKACKDEIAGGKRGVNCSAFETANTEANKMIRANPAGFVGVRVNLK
ncbi:hypothetical protein [Ralstonia sp. OTU4908]|jgi:hypothetical protein|uniref:hypothetical protein n=1 Tax=Ralstonia sp. OTU4908 TaxID=3043851 RepID=UPI00313D7E46